MNFYERGHGLRQLAFGVGVEEQAEAMGQVPVWGESRFLFRLVNGTYFSA